MKYPGVKDRLLWLGMSQVELADKIGVDYKRLSNKLNGYNYMDVETALLISKALGKSVEELFRYVVEEE